jgi:co-chaperonin GroES (HSP10)
MQTASNLESQITYTIPDIDPALLPDPVGEMVLLVMPVVEAKTKGGIVLPESTQRTSEFLVQAGKVVKIGPEAFARDYQRLPCSAGRWFEVGDWVIPGVNQGQPVEVRAPDGTMVKCKLIHAGLILGTTRNPEATVTYL